MLSCKTSHQIPIDNIMENNSSSEMIIYNRIPKCGSDRTFKLIQILAKSKKFTVLKEIYIHNMSISHYEYKDAKRVSLTKYI